MSIFVSLTIFILFFFFIQEQRSPGEIAELQSGRGLPVRTTTASASLDTPRARHPGAEVV